MKCTILLATTVVGFWMAGTTAHAGFLEDLLDGVGPAWPSSSSADVIEEEDELSEDDLETFAEILQEVARQQQARQFRPMPRTWPPQAPAERRLSPQFGGFQQPRGPSQQDLLQLLQVRKSQAAQLERLIPIAEQQASSYRGTSGQLGIPGGIFQMPFDNQVRIYQLQYTAVMADIQAIEARLRGF